MLIGFSRNPQLRQEGLQVGKQLVDQLYKEERFTRPMVFWRNKRACAQICRS
jgi:hypothetical protein